MYGHELADRWEQIGEQVAEQIEANGKVLHELNRDRDGFEKEATEATGALATAYLPALTAEALALAEQRTGFRGFSKFDPTKAMEKERQQLEHDIARIRADDRYIRRNALVGEYGELTRRRAEAADMIEPFAAECKRFEDLEGFQELVDLGYDTPGFALRWWEPRYWRLWAAGDRICETLGMADFGDDVLPAYQKVAEPREKWRIILSDLDDQIRNIHELVRRHDQDQERLGRLPEIYLEEARQALVKHLELADAALLETWAEGDRGIVMGLRRHAGSKARLGYIDEILMTVRSQQEDMKRQRAKCRTKAGKYRMPKRHYVQLSDAPPEGLAARRDKYQAFRDRALADAEALQRKPDYESFVLADNPPELWWNHLTRRRPSRLVPRTREWYDRNPSVYVSTETHDTSRSVAGAMDRSMDDLGDLS